MRYYKASLVFSVCLAAFCSAVQDLYVLDRNLKAGYCSASGTDQSLQERFNCADVVLTGTIIKFDDDRPNNKSNDSLSDCVKVWTVLKPIGLNLKQFINRELQRKVRRIRSKRDAGMRPASRSQTNKLAIIGNKKPNQPILEVYNIHDRVVGGSILQEGDTRAFFLRRRQRAFKRKRSLVETIEVSEEPEKKYRKERKKRQRKPSSLLSLEELVPQRLSLAVLNELDRLSKEEKTSFYGF